MKEDVVPGFVDETQKRIPCEMARWVVVPRTPRRLLADRGRTAESGYNMHRHQRWRSARGRREPGIESVEPNDPSLWPGFARTGRRP